MRPDTLTIHQLFERERRFVVPLYQRSYVWNEDDQWLPLWDDLERAADACLTAARNQQPRSHFLGALVLNVPKVQGSRVSRSEVIDGQQRLTTLQIVLAAMRDHAEAMSSSEGGPLRDLTENRHQKSGSEELFKVWPTNADRATFRAVMRAGSPDALLDQFPRQRSGLPRLAAAYRFFWDRIGAFLDEADTAVDREARLDALHQALRTVLQVVVIELEERDDPQVIFETLNARGQPLLPSDLLRNYIFLRAASEPGVDPDALYQHYWHEFDNRRQDGGEERFWHAQERQGRLTRPRIDLFLFHYLVMQTGRDLLNGQLFREFRDWHAESQMSVEALLTDLNRYAVIFAGLVEPKGNDRPAVFAQRLKALDTSTVYPLLLYILSLPSSRLPVAARDRILLDLESWLVRRFICQATAKNYNRFFTSLLTKVTGASPDADLADIVRSELTRSAEATTNWPIDREFRTGWLTKPIYARSRPDRSAMVLRAIEQHMRTRFNEAVSLPDQLSVEHMLPQKGALEDYPYPLDMPYLDQESDAQCRTRLIQTLGNLTLLTGELNASISNGPFPSKAAKVIGDSDLRLNAWLRSAPPLSWSERDILARGDRLFEIALQVWPRPSLEVEDVAPHGNSSSVSL
jgi:hypothetical protein